MTTDLSELLVKGEHAAFHGKPAAAVGFLEKAVLVAQDQGRHAEVAAAAWLLGVALGAGGRYGAALTVLTPLIESGSAPTAPPERALFASLASGTVASVHRQLGRHAIARNADEAALDLSGGAGEAAYDAHLGLASDAIGMDDPIQAQEHLSAAASLLPARADEWWRQRVRMGWAQAELALLEGEIEAAVSTAKQAVDRAEQARAPRHVAKGLLIQGIAQVSADEDEAPLTLRRAATLAESLGTLPLIWPARALLGALVEADNPEESNRSLASARTALLTIAQDLPEGVRAEWFARPDVAALLEG